jgi:hypothetical protein
LSLVYEWGKGNLEWIMPRRMPAATGVERGQELERLAR